jgi:protein-S-isoprenylcysteine O-methyltransferase Ste14
LRAAVYDAWLVFWVYWLIASLRVKRGTRPRRRVPPGAWIVTAAFVLTQVLAGHQGAPHDPAVRVVGVIAFACGLALAVWARVHLGRNWGMPMSEKLEPELVTSGPYRLIRHPIYTGILLAMLGTSLAADVYWLVPFVVTAGYFVHSAHVEERSLEASFPADYANYRKRTKMLIPFLL